MCGLSLLRARASIGYTVVYSELMCALDRDLHAADVGLIGAIHIAKSMQNLYFSKSLQFVASAARARRYQRSGCVRERACLLMRACVRSAAAIKTCRIQQRATTQLRTRR